MRVLKKALAHLDDRDPPFLLVSGRAVESDYADGMRQLALRLGVERQVRFLGATPHDLVLSLMRESVACVIPSRFENPGRVPVEAMATGMVREIDALAAAPLPAAGTLRSALDPVGPAAPQP